MTDRSKPASGGRRDFLRAGVALMVLPAASLQDSLAGRGAVGTLRDPSAVGRPVVPTDPEENAAVIQAIELRLACNCGCTLDVFTCRTTDFSCGVSPAMHRDVISLVNGGYNAAEIMTAFQSVYGERVLMAPLKQGFNWVGYIMPFAAIIGGGGIVATLIRKWGRKQSASVPVAVGRVDATPDELRALSEAMRDDS